MKKSIQVIEVENGWMVRTSFQDWSSVSGAGCFVFNTIEDLQKELPNLLKIEKTESK